ncbi:hypothetical protein CDAR_492981 [Caerostris darwini]|uniref:Uncharacterized protein n=1 Tax=Caerostris darwini TaxID=1538125 RepID=A0AAV4TEF4_9ARAC|nr:hypothetical protein CDAR_492981 [Caerostris darwini]
MASTSLKTVICDQPLAHEWVELWICISHLDNKKGLPCESTLYEPCLGESNPRTFHQGSHYVDTSCPNIILGPVHVSSSIRQPPAWSAVHVCESRASMTNANEEPHSNIRN